MAELADAPDSARVASVEDFSPSYKTIKYAPVVELADTPDFARVTSVEGFSPRSYKKQMCTCGGIGRHAEFRSRTLGGRIGTME